LGRIEEKQVSTKEVFTIQKVHGWNWQKHWIARAPKDQMQALVVPPPGYQVKELWSVLDVLLAGQNAARNLIKRLQ
jgi:hypothetical protein